MRKERTYTYLSTTQGMCRECRSIVPARIIEESGQVWQERLCSACGKSRALIADDVTWYLEIARTTVLPRKANLPGRNVDKGCPHDCGPCSFHAGACNLPVFSVTNACNLECPICSTYNRKSGLYFMSREELRRIVDGVVARAGPLDLVNITGGEPTLHPDIFGLIAECQRPEIGRVTVSSNGLRLAEDKAFCEELARLGAYVILSFNTLNGDTSRRIHGSDIVEKKLAALRNLQDCRVGTTLLNVMIQGVNDHEIGDIIRLSRDYDVVWSITVQSMAFTGRGGKDFQPRRHIPLDGVARAIEKATAGVMRREHFVPLPSAHPLCYGVAYFFKTGDRYDSFTDLFGREHLRKMLSGGYLLQPDGTAQEILKETFDRLRAEGGNEVVLKKMKELISDLYPPGRTLGRFERQRIAEGHILAVYPHSRMDEDTLDIARLVTCPDQVADREGRLIPACAYNLLYRMKN